VEQFWAHAALMYESCVRFNQTQVTRVRVLVIELWHSSSCTCEFGHMGKQTQIDLLHCTDCRTCFIFRLCRCSTLLLDWIASSSLVYTVQIGRKRLYSACAVCAGFVNALCISAMCHYRVEVILYAIVCHPACVNVVLCHHISLPCMLYCVNLCMCTYD